MTKEVLVVRDIENKFESSACDITIMYRDRQNFFFLYLIITCLLLSLHNYYLRKRSRPLLHKFRETVVSLQSLIIMCLLLSLHNYYLMERSGPLLHKSSETVISLQSYGAVTLGILLNQHCIFEMIHLHFSNCICVE